MIFWKVTRKACGNVPRTPMSARHSGQLTSGLWQAQAEKAADGQLLCLERGAQW